MDVKIVIIPLIKETKIEYNITINNATKYFPVNAFLKTIPSLNESLNLPLAKDTIASGITYVVNKKVKSKIIIPIPRFPIAEVNPNKLSPVAEINFQNKINPITIQGIK